MTIDTNPFRKQHSLEKRQNESLRIRADGHGCSIYSLGCAAPRSVCAKNQDTTTLSTSSSGLGSVMSDCLPNPAHTKQVRCGRNCFYIC